MKVSTAFPILAPALTVAAAPAVGMSPSVSLCLLSQATTSQVSEVAFRVLALFRRTHFQRPNVQRDQDFGQAREPRLHRPLLRR
ncbi:uncharacterized protein EI97DRAFT_433012 [Westerdykella ornata]|uniref:Secreted protein n=1 Tax=Westerdykella ornata TaxID=318751 RepID=A0A6A6JL01_WESOR|nr:uncharacterized protein EI97DRAFT_433012 [Westerdykella ornata]KAF2276783.1 hypothetical protein EI97DRAFT_433012 [Westerdykella ornata]